jgi:hypothetical protein
MEAVLEIAGDVNDVWAVSLSEAKDNNSAPPQRYTPNPSATH